MKGSVYKRCTCEDPLTGRLQGARCPKLKSSKHGTWTYVADIPADTRGTRRQQRRGGFKTEKAAQEALATLTAQVSAGTYVDSLRMTVGDYLDEWLVGKGSLRPSTRANYRQHIELHLKPNVGHLKLSDLRSAHIEALLRAARQGERPIGPATARRIFATLRVALNKAVRQGRIAINPCSFVELESEEEHRRPGSVWLPEHVGAFLDAMSSHRLGPLFEVLVKAGLRRGEVIGLRWSDLDLEDAMLNVAQSVVQVGGSLHVGAPKTRKSVRRVPLDADTIKSLRAHKRRQLEERLMAGSGWVETDRVFTRPDGAGLVPEYVSRTFRALVVTSGLPEIRLHDLRHTSASLALAAGVPMRVVSERLGHSTIGITQNLYTHVFDQLSRDAADKIANVIPRRIATDQ